LNAELEQLSQTDELTGINNHRSLLQLSEREFSFAMRYRTPLSVLMFDVDYFKQINDAFGHAMGDQTLKKIVQVVCAELRSADVIGRYGGDEFIILLPNTGAQESLPLAERIHASIAALRMDTLTVTLSIGIAQTFHGSASESGVVSQPDTVENLFLRADQAMYAAKQNGRNCTVIFDSRESDWQSDLPSK
jgi:diguanylate cyclase (GGDEF)-like protein